MLLALVSLMHDVFVGHAIDFIIALNCITCPYDHLLYNFHCSHFLMIFYV